MRKFTNFFEYMKCVTMRAISVWEAREGDLHIEVRCVGDIENEEKSQVKAKISGGVTERIGNNA